MTLANERRLQIKMAHQALDRGDKEAALAWIGADLDGLCLRVKAAVERQIGLATSRRFLLPRGERREASTMKVIKEFLRQNPDFNTHRVAIEMNVSESTVRRARGELKAEKGEGCER
jgi:hypothetical protein